MTAHAEPSIAQTSNQSTAWSPPAERPHAVPAAPTESPAAAEPAAVAPANPQQSALAAAILGHWGAEDSGRVATPPSVALPNQEPRNFAWNAARVYTPPTPPAATPESREPGSSTATDLDVRQRALTRTHSQLMATPEGTHESVVRQSVALAGGIMAGSERSQLDRSGDNIRTDTRGRTLGYTGGTLTAGLSQVSSQTNAGALTDYREQSIRFGYNPTTSDLSIAGNVAFRGSSANASVALQRDHLGLSFGAATPGLGASITLDDVHNRERQQAIERNDGSAYAQMFGGHGYVTASRQDSFSIGGSVGIRSAGVGGGYNTDSTVEMLAQLPEDWSQRTPAERTAFEQAQRERLQGVHGLADVNLENLASGAGVRFTMTNGWNAHAGVSYGVGSVQGGGGQSAVQQVTIARQDERLRVSLASGNTDTFSAGAGVGPGEVSVAHRETDTRRFEFEVDPSNPQAQEAMARFVQTGLLPGADQVTDPQTPALQSFHHSRARIDELRAQLADLQQPGRTDAAAAERVPALTLELEAAQRELQASRASLNQQLQSRAGAGTELSPGIRVTSTTDQEDRDTTARIGVSGGPGLDLGGHQQSWVHQQQLSARGSVEHSFAYRDRHTSLFLPTTDRATVANTDQTGLVWGMSSLHRLTTEGDVSSVRRIGQTDIPSYVLDAEGRRVTGTTTVAMNHAQMDRMSGYLNNMDHDSSRAMWDEFGTRTAAFLRGDMSTVTGADRPERADVIRQRQWVRGLMSRRSEGGQPASPIGELAQHFATVHSPEDFHRLSPQDQQLFVEVLNQTSGPRRSTAEHPDPRAATRNPYESVAAISLIEDPVVRTQQLRDLFVQIHRQSAQTGQDPVATFTNFAERFRDDPATYSSIQSAISFHWSQPEVEGMLDSANPLHNEAYRAQQVARSVERLTTSSAWSEAMPNQELESGSALTALLAANRHGGPEELRRVLGAADPRQFLSGLSGDPVRQHMLYDLLVQSGYADQLTGVSLAFAR